MSHLTRLLGIGATTFGCAFLGGACSGEDAAAPPPQVPTVDASQAVPIPTTTDTATRPPPPPDASNDAPSSSCFRQLKDKGIAYEPTVARGVVDAVHVKSPIGGIAFLKEDTDELSGDPMDCTFVLALERFAQILKSKGVVKVGTLGSYCYRCCCEWSPTNDCRSPTDPEPNCGSNGYSNHSWGRAIDVQYLYMQDGNRYDIENVNQWVAGSSSTTCTSGLAAQTGVSKFLYSTVCEVVSKVIFKTILTPNYNDAHRNHWHMDTGQSGTPTGATTIRADEGATLLDVGDHPDRCGGH
jgi:hypothetical protein